jgi:hypothetical protein
VGSVGSDRNEHMMALLSSVLHYILLSVSGQWAEGGTCVHVMHIKHN